MFLVVLHGSENSINKANLLVTGVISQIKETLVQVTNLTRMPEHFFIKVCNISVILFGEVLAPKAYRNRINI